MATLADSLASSAQRRLRVRKRPDLTARRQRYLGKSYWVVKEPVGLNYFRFQDEEYAILNMIDGRSSLEEIKERFEAEYPPQKITLEELQQFLGMLHRSGLVVADVPGQGRQLRKRRDERRRQEILNALSNILCIRFKGVDPERFLNWLYPRVRWCFHPVTVVISLLLIFSAIALVLVEFDVFRSRLPGFYQFFSPTNALWLAVVLAVSKILHELAHGLLCKHFGGECHEIGIMILVLTPCLYCNVSDSWMLPNKWHRAAIGAAGIYVECLLAAICTFIWWFTEPGLLNNICLNMMFIASVSTILFNGNPLLRYDGYYVLADIVEIPNLRQKATSILNRKMGEWFLGIEPSEDPFLPQRNQIFFILYTIAAVVYRWFILLSILYFLFKVFEPYGLQIIGHIIVAMSLYGLIVMPLYKLGKFFYVPGRLEKVKKPRMYASLAGLAMLLGVFFFVPMPFSVTAPLEIQARDAAHVYVDVPGVLVETCVQPGREVEAGHVLARLESTDLELEILKTESQKTRVESRLENLRQRYRYQDPRLMAEIVKAEDDLASLQRQLEHLRSDQRKLTLVAPVAGTVLPPPWIPPREDPDGALPTWSGTPLLPENVGSFFEQGTLFCQVGDPRHMEAILYVDQADVGFVEIGHAVEIKLDELPHDVLEGQVVEISPDAVRVVPRHMTTKAKGEIPTETDPTGVERPQPTLFKVRVHLEDPQGLLRLALRGRAKIHCAPQTLATRAWRLLTETFNFRL
ncbi:MAG TPA: HlyD family efflux transporter periplasmic adaptor subunit [Planctomycetes bacterium]|nr:HlyD family efflux transporter periplasmic adaptor subunit [Planctomycetota bacterium]